MVLGAGLMLRLELLVLSLNSFVFGTLVGSRECLPVLSTVGS